MGLDVVFLRAGVHADKALLYIQYISKPLKSSAVYWSTIKKTLIGTAVVGIAPHRAPLLNWERCVWLSSGHRIGKHSFIAKD